MKALFALLALLPVVALADSSSRGYGRTYDNDIRTNRYGTSEAGQVRRADAGVVVAIREVYVSRDRTAVGSVTGAVAGGVIGHNVSRGRNRNTNTVIGAILGTIIGSSVERHRTVQIGHEIIIRMRGGRTIAVTQGPDDYVRLGDTVYVIYDNRNRTRVVRG